MFFVSDSCGRNYGGDGVGNRSSGVAETETDAVAHDGDRNRGSCSGNIEAAEPRGTYICATNKILRINKYKSCHFVMCICVFTNKTVFRQNKYTKDGGEGEKSSHGRKTIFCVFVYLCAS
jgi:hypothetical protein